MVQRESSVTKIILSRLDKINEKLDRIEIQTTATNGRVGRLEEKSQINTQRLEQFGERISAIETSDKINLALNSTGKYWTDLLIRVGPWILMAVFIIFELLRRTGLLKY